MSLEGLEIVPLKQLISSNIKIFKIHTFRILIIFGKYTWYFMCQIRLFILHQK